MSKTNQIENRRAMQRFEAALLENRERVQLLLPLEDTHEGTTCPSLAYSDWDRLPQIPDFLGAITRHTILAIAYVLNSFVWAPTLVLPDAFLEVLGSPGRSSSGSTLQDAPSPL